MGRIISVVSGKGGVGKTTVTAELGIALAKRGLKVCLIDADVAMANLSLLLNMQSAPITLHDVLLGESAIQDSIYDGPAGVKFIPSGLSLENYRRVDPERLQSVIESIANQFDFILLDCPAGIEKSVLAAIAASDEILLVTVPNSPSIADAFKAKATAQRLGIKSTGVIVNFIFEEKGEINPNEIMRMMELPIYGLIPYDPEMRRSFMQDKATPLMVRRPSSPAAMAIQKTASKLSGLPVQFNAPEKKKSFWDMIFGFLKKKPKTGAEAQNSAK